MAQNYEIDIKRFNGTDYDTLFPTPASHALTHLPSGSDPIWNYTPGMVNPNLLNNWYFVGGGSQQGGSQFPINQRGKTSYTSSGYAIDRWKIQGGNTVVSLTQDGLVFRKGTLTGYALLTQISENVPEGQAMVFSGLLDGNIITANIPAGWVYSDSEKQLISASAISAGGERIYIYIYARPGASIETRFYFGATQENTMCRTVVKAVKLELGSQQTLAHQENGVWVLNEIPDFGEQLAKCQRYYVLPDNTGNAWPFLTVTSANYLIILIPTAVPMRTNPSVVANSNGTDVYNGGWISIDSTKFISYLFGSGVLLRARISDFSEITWELGRSYIIRNLPGLSADP